MVIVVVEVVGTVFETFLSLLLGLFVTLCCTPNVTWIDSVPNTRKLSKKTRLKAIVQLACISFS